ncbi:DUF2165 domain-containing protein [Streptomyces orinoci]|uniref:DUF2165 domain-containing protein n=2 Tax=Streptomyces orinoci TaxID=67339 RepID=A0ABV3K4D6_STRON|nr:DUF2165 domain-containing protein [Streptomyces orinoci]
MLRAGWARRRRTVPGSLTTAATALTAIVALYTVLVAFGNITDFDTNRQFVRHVLAMDTTFRSDHLMWRAITSHALQDLAYLAIIAWEVLTAAVLVTGTVYWLRGPALRQRACRVSTLGLVLFLLLFGMGFIAIGGEWFAMWQSAKWNGLQAAERNFLVAGLALIVVNLPHPQG